MSTDATVAAAPPSQDQSTQRPGGKADLFARRKQQTRRVSLPGHQKSYLLAALRPIEVQEVNTFCLESHPDPKDPSKTVTRFSPMRPFYLIARSLQESEGKAMFGANEGGAQAGWIYGGQQCANFLTNREANILFDGVSDLSGIGAGAEEQAEKNS